MSRHTFITSDETREVINGHAKDMAKAYGCDRSYYDQIVSEHETDAFEKFLRSLYIPALMCGRPVTAWIVRLQIEAERYKPAPSQINLKAGVAAFTRESADVPASHINGAALETQLREVDEVLEHALNLKSTIIQAINERDAERSGLSQLRRKA